MTSTRFVNFLLNVNFWANMNQIHCELLKCLFGHMDLSTTILKKIYVKHVDQKTDDERKRWKSRQSTESVLLNSRLPMTSRFFCSISVFSPLISAINSSFCCTILHNIFNSFFLHTKNSTNRGNDIKQ